MTWIKPPALKLGDAVSLIAPAGPVPEERALAAVEFLRQAGYRPVYREDALTKTHYLAGDDERRLAELTQAFTDPSTRAVIAFRGGYGTTRLLPRLDFGLFQQHPKPLLGFSDLSALHLALFKHPRLCTLHGPQGVTLPTSPVPVVERVFRLLSDPAFTGPATPHPLRVLREGLTEGRLVVSNLSLLAALAGTPYLPDLRGAILVLEDVGEAAYRLDRLLTQVDQAGILAGLGGLVLGDLRPITGEEATVLSLTESRLMDLCAPYTYPVLTGLSVGHIDENWPIPCGVMARLSSSQANLFLLEGMVR